MCGIVYAHDFKGDPVNNGILNQFDMQRNRGTQGFGLFDGKEMNIVKAANEDKILKWLAKYDSNLLLFHHRLPTSTPNTKRTAHPFATGKFFGDNEYILVHNGHISNCYSLKHDHEKLGIAYQGLAEESKFNDSESLLWDLALYLEGKQDKVQAYGGMAFVCIKLHKGKLDRLYFGRNSYPLNMLKVKRGLMLSSEGPGNSINSNLLYTWNYDLKRLTNKQVVFPNWQSQNKPKSAGTYVPYQSPYHSSVERAMEEVEEERESNPGYNLEDFQEKFDEMEVMNKVLRYLIAANGNYSTAYDAMDLESMQLDGLEDDYESVREKELLWAAMDMMDDDPEWVNQNSICKLFREAREQAKEQEANDASTLQLPLPV